MCPVICGGSGYSVISAVSDLMLDMEPRIQQDNGTDINGCRVLVGACGSASVLSLPSYLIAMQTKLNCHITVVMTATATEFLPARSISLCSDVVYAPERPMLTFGPNHVQLAEESDAILILPATAHMLSIAAQGQAPNLLGAIVLAASRPVTFFPAMNRLMWSKPAVQRNAAQLRADGHEVVEPSWQASFEAATRTMAENPVLPSPSRVADHLAMRLREAGPTGAAAD
jgi:phosphopantothenoylcysteine decarboxylase